MREPKERECYGFIDGETFYGEVDELVNDWIDSQWPDPVEYPATPEIEIGYGTPKSLSSYACIETLFDDAAENAGERVGDCADGWLGNVTDNQRDDLLRLIDEWAEKHGHHPRFWEIARTEKAEIVILNEDGDWKWKEEK